jgi:hypothetical protein
MTPIQIFQKACDISLQIGFEPPDTLTVEPARLCAAEFAGLLKANKPALLALLKLPFVVVESQILQEMTFFCEDDDTRGALVKARASEWSIYTRYELQMLCAQNRIAPLTAAELRKIQEIKRTFNGSLSESFTSARNTTTRPLTGPTH